MERVYALGGVAFFYALVFSIGMIAARRAKGDSAAEVLVAGRRMPLWIGIFTMTATWVDGGYLNGTAEAVYGRGLVWAQAPWGFALSLLLGGFFFAPQMHRQNFTTMLDPFQQRFGDRTGMLMYLPAMLGELFWTSGILAALGTTFGVLLNINFSLAIIISAAITITYTYHGGLWSIAYTDVAQLVIAFFGMGICLPFVFHNVGSLPEVWSQYSASFGPKAALIPPINGLGLETWAWWDSLLLLILGGIPWHCYFQRVLSSPTPEIARMLSIAAAFACIVMAVPPALIGMAGAVFDWQAHGMQPPAGDFLILPTVLRDLTPRWVGICGLCAVAGAIMSSVDASIYSASSMFTWNVYARLRPASADAVRTVNRVAIIVIGTVAAAIALTVQSIYALWFLCADLVYVMLFPQLLATLYLRRINSFGIVCGFLVSLVLRIGGGEPTLGIPAFLPYPQIDGNIWFPFKTVGMLAGLATTIVASRVKSRGIEHDVPWLASPAVAERQ